MWRENWKKEIESNIGIWRGNEKKNWKQSKNRTEVKFELQQFWKKKKKMEKNIIEIHLKTKDIGVLQNKWK